MSEWRDIGSAPDKPMAVLFLNANAAALYEAENPDHAWDWSLPENQALLVDVGYWNGNQWRWAGTNHDVFEFGHKPGDAGMPTHWQPLPRQPDQMEE